MQIRSDTKPASNRFRSYLIPLLSLAGTLLLVNSFYPLGQVGPIAFLGGSLVFIVIRIPFMKPVKEECKKIPVFVLVVFGMASWIFWIINSFIPIALLLVLCAAMALPWEKALLLVVINLSFWPMNPVSIKTTQDYLAGDATIHLYGNIISPHADEINPELKCGYTWKGCGSGSGFALATINNKTLAFLVRTFGPQRNSPTRDYPSYEEATNELRENGVLVTSANLENLEFKLDGKLIGLSSELIAKLFKDYYISHVNPDHKIIEICWYDTDLLLMNHPTMSGGHRMICFDVDTMQLIAPSEF